MLSLQLIATVPGHYLTPGPNHKQFLKTSSSAKDNRTIIRPKLEKQFFHEKFLPIKLKTGSSETNLNIRQRKQFSSIEINNLSQLLFYRVFPSSFEVEVVLELRDRWQQGAQKMKPNFCGAAFLKSFLIFSVLLVFCSKAERAPSVLEPV